MGWLAAFLLGMLFGPRVRREIERNAPPNPWPGESPPKAPPTPPSEELPAPPRGYKPHPDPIPERAKARAKEWGPRLEVLGLGSKAGPELDDWKGDGTKYPILFRWDEYRGRRGVGIYVDASERVGPPPVPPTPVTPPKPIKPMPGGWRVHPTPIPQKVVQAAWSYLQPLWSQGEGSYEIESANWKGGDAENYQVLFRAESHAGGKKGVTAYVRS